MRRARRPRSELSIALFPFLAVLLCTMGALIVVLVVVTRRAQAHGREEATAVAALSLGTAEERELLEFRLQKLTEQQRAILEDLERRRLTLGQIEDHHRQLTAQLAELERAYAQLDDVRAGDHEVLASLREQQAQIERRLALAEKALREAEQARKQRAPSYTIVPYEGPNGTRRRPIYLECRHDAVILQPEGVVFHEEDFLGAQGPGNPLATAVRAAREYFVVNRYGSDDDRDSYPLLLVRPRGVAAYYVARAALSSWNTEFGYELVDEDWQLEFPPPDPKLADVLRQAAEDARTNQRLLAEHAPRSTRGRGGRSFRASPTGSGIVEEPSDDGGGGGGWHQPPFTAGRGFSPPARAGSAFGEEEPGSGTFGRVATDVDRVAAVYGGAGEGSTIAGAVEPESPGPRLGAGPGGAAESPGSNTPSSIANMPQPEGATGGPEGASRLASGRVPGTAPGANDTAANVAAHGEAGGAGAPGSGEPAGQPRGGTQGAAGNPLTAATSGASSTPGMAGTAESMAAAPPADTPPIAPQKMANFGYSGGADGPSDGNVMRRMAERRGNDWALPERGRGAIPVSRDIRVVCRPDGLVLAPGNGSRGQGRFIPFERSTAAALDKFVSNVWEHMETWGIAGQGMYWLPVLQVDVVPGGEERFREFQQLMGGSGLDVRERRVATARGGNFRPLR